MSADQARKTMLRWYEAINRKDLEALGECVTDDFVSHYMGTQGRDAYLQYFQGLFEAFPDLQGEVLDAVSDGELAAVRVRLSGTHEGEFAGIPATGKRVKVEASDFCRVNSDGLFTEHWAHADNLSIMQQLGAIPE